MPPKSRNAAPIFTVVCVGARSRGAFSPLRCLLPKALDRIFINHHLHEELHEEIYNQPAPCTGMHDILPFARSITPLIQLQIPNLQVFCNNP
jgi:hypothetical protein